MTIGLTYAQLKDLSPCTDTLADVTKKLGGARKWGKLIITAGQARAAGCSFDNIVWAASAVARTNPDIERRLRLWMADCAARVLHVYEKTETSSAPREAIVAARRFARGEITAAAWAAAWDAEEKWQFDRLIARLSDDEPEDWPLPAIPVREEKR